MPNFLLGCAGGIQYLSLKRASKNPRKAQEKTLREILTYARDTEYGKEHHFAEILEAKTDIELYARYQKYVQLNDYEDLRPYVEKHKHGASNILFPGKPVLYATTSGTTKEPKWVPITKEYLHNIYGKMTKVWLFNFIKNRPEVFTGKIVSIVGKVKEGEAPDGTMFGSVSGVTQRDCPGFVKKLYASPASVFSIEDYTARYYTLMRMGIERNITLVVTANPSTIVEMQNNVNEYFDDYCTDIEYGTLNAQLNIPQWIREDIQPYLKPNPERAAELRALKAKYGTVLPKHYWPNMQILNTWKCGNTAVYLDKINGSFPEQMLHQEFGYFAPRMNIVEFLDYVCILKGIKNKAERKEKIASAIETVGLVGEEKKRLGKYSGGMLRRAGIAQALIGDPKVLIIDEPTTGLDPEERLYFLNLLSKIAMERTIIFSTHITADIEHLCNNICVLEQGEVKYLGEKAEFINRINGKLYEHTGSQYEEEQLRKDTIVTSVAYVDGRPRVRYVAEAPLFDGSVPVAPTLEDSYIYALGGVKR